MNNDNITKKDDPNYKEIYYTIIKESKISFEHICNKYNTLNQDKDILNENWDIEALTCESLEHLLHALNRKHVMVQEESNWEIKS